MPRGSTTPNPEGTGTTRLAASSSHARRISQRRAGAGARATDWAKRASVSSVVDRGRAIRWSCVQSAQSLSRHSRMTFSAAPAVPPGARLSHEDRGGKLDRWLIHAVDVLWQRRPVIPTEPIGSIPRPLELSRRSRATTATIRASIRSTRRRSGTPSSGSKRPARRSSPTASSASTTTSGPTASMGCRTPRPMASRSRSRPATSRRMPRLTRGPVPLQALRRQLPRRRDALRARAAEAGGHLAVRAEPDVSGRGHPRLLARAVHRRSAARARDGDPRAVCAKGAYKVQIDFTEGRFAMKIDPSGELLHSFIDLNNLALSRFSADERQRIGVHTCPGGDRDSTHSADVDYADLLPSLFELKAGNFYVALAGESRSRRVLRSSEHFASPTSRSSSASSSPIDPRIESAGGSPRPRARGGEVHSARPAGHDRRLRVLAVLRRHVDRSATRPSPRSRRACRGPGWPAPHWTPASAGPAARRRRRALASIEASTRSDVYARSPRRTRTAFSWPGSGRRRTCSTRKRRSNARPTSSRLRFRCSRRRWSRPPMEFS